MRVSAAMSKRLLTLAFELQQTGDPLDAQAAAWILGHEGRDRRRAGRRTPRTVRVRLANTKQGADFELPAGLLAGEVD